MTFEPLVMAGLGASFQTCIAACQMAYETGRDVQTTIFNGKVVYASPHDDPHQLYRAWAPEYDV